MADITDIANEFIREEIEEFIERDEERERIISLFAQASETDAKHRRGPHRR